MKIGSTFVIFKLLFKIRKYGQFLFISLRKIPILVYMIGRTQTALRPLRPLAAKIMKIAPLDGKTNCERNRKFRG